jgi:pantothenate kinase
MESTLNDLLSHVENNVGLKSSSSGVSVSPRRSSASVQQYWIAVAGAPGSGKSTLSKELAAGLNARGIRTTVIPMDGFHYYRRELDQMPNSDEAHARRGSHWTFNATRLVQVMLFTIFVKSNVRK